MPFDITFKKTFNCIVAGPSSSGKTTLIRNILKLRERLFISPPAKIFWYYNAYQQIYEHMLSEGIIDELINAKESFPDVDTITQMVRPFKEQGGCLVVFDDIMTNLTPEFEQIFCNLSHHENASVILMSQNLLYNSKIYRTLSLNTHYFIIMKSERGKSQVQFLSRQICPDNPNYILRSYIAATKRPYSYMLIDVCSDSPTEIRLRSNILPNEFPTKVFLEK